MDTHQQRRTAARRSLLGQPQPWQGKSRRAQQLAEGANPLVDLKGLKTSDPMFLWTVAKMEIAQRKLPYIIRRQLPNNTSEFWSVQELEMIW
jgi:DNA-directed RNA polymerase I, II, and III subunit RPABC2